MHINQSIIGVIKKMRTWREYLIEKFADREKAISYLQIALEEYQVDGDTIDLC